ncbi:MAG: hypothetical protein HQL70_04485 [Magnetococcales bacterium]|nr:hypothetical protein [Magnetococcales bacterium]
MAEESYPFDYVDAEQLVAEWQDKSRLNIKISGRKLIERIAADAIAEPSEADYQMLGLKPYQFLKRKAFIRHFRSAKTYVWKRAVMELMPIRVTQIMDGVDDVLMAMGSTTAKSGKQTKLHLLLYDEIVDNFSEEGFLSVTLHLVQRILGDVEKKPDNIVIAVNYSDHLEQQYQLCLQKIAS